MIEKEIERLYELIRFEEKKLEIQNQIKMTLDEKRKLEENKEKRDKWILRACRSLLAFCLAIVGAIISFINPFVQLFMFLVLLVLLDFLLGKVFAIFQRLQLSKVIKWLIKTYKRDEINLMSQYSRKLENLNRLIERRENDQKELIEIIKQKAAFLPSSFHNLESFQSLYDYLHFGQATELESALYLHEQRFRHEENMEISPRLLLQTTTSESTIKRNEGALRRKSTKNRQT